MPTTQVEKRKRRSKQAGAEAATGARQEDWAFFVGNATLLLRMGPFIVLTDPNFVHRGAEVPLGFGLTATRTTDPALDIDDMERPDLVIVSHDHGDHFDAVAADWLDRSVPIATAPAAVSGMVEKGFTDVRGLQSWESTELDRDDARLRVTAVPAQHGSGPMAAAMPEVIGSVLEYWEAGAGEPADAEPRYRVYFSGDTVFHEGLAEIRDRFGEVDVAFLHLGGMRLLGVTVTMDAAQGVQLINLLQPRLAIPIHYNDYGTSSSTLAEFVTAVNEAGLAGRVRYLRHGDAWPLAGRTAGGS
ncbi:MAG TPA: MBL fold metallo-hydrolase [Candidatus Limnocylindria bacterium]